MNALTSAAAIATAAPAAALPNLAERDPIYAAMATYRKVYDDQTRFLRDEYNAVESRMFELAWAHAAKFAPDLCAKWTAAGGDDDPTTAADPERLKIWRQYGYPELARLKQDDPAYQEVEERGEELSKALTDAVLAFARTVPTTDAGALAMLTFISVRAQETDEVGGDYDGADEPLEHMIMASVATYLRNIGNR